MWSSWCAQMKLVSSKAAPAGKPQQGAATPAAATAATAAAAAASVSTAGCTQLKPSSEELAFQKERFDSFVQVVEGSSK